MRLINNTPEPVVLPDLGLEIVPGEEKDVPVELEDDQQPPAGLSRPTAAARKQAKKLQAADDVEPTTEEAQ